MVVNVMLVSMRCDNKSILAVRQFRRKFNPDFICFLRGHFAWLERLADMISNDLIGNIAAGVLKICVTVEHEFICSRFRDTGINSA